MFAFSMTAMTFSAKEIAIRPDEIGFSIFSSVQYVFSSVANWFTGTIEAVGRLSNLKSENEILRQKLEEYESISGSIVELKYENAALKEQLSFKKSLEYASMAAEIIGHDGGVVHQTLILNKGSMDNIKKNMPVVAFQDGMYGIVGKISAVGPFSSQVIPVYSPQFSVHSRFQRSRNEGLVSGNKKVPGMLLMGDVNKHASRDITTGDVIVTSGSKSSLFPKGLAVGTVVEINAQEYTNSLEILVEPAIDFSKIEYVFILVSGQENP
jgi:rod shape-determining protein MreC